MCCDLKMHVFVLTFNFRSLSSFCIQVKASSFFIKKSGTVLIAVLLYVHLAEKNTFLRFIWFHRDRKETLSKHSSFVHQVPQIQNHSHHVLSWISTYPWGKLGKFSSKCGVAIYSWLTTSCQKKPRWQLHLKKGNQRKYIIKQNTFSGLFRGSVLFLWKTDLNL